MAEEPAFEVGDLVYLKSGGPCMVVINNDSDLYTCQWFSEGSYSGVQSARFGRNVILPWDEEEVPKLSLKPPGGQ